MAKRIEYLNGNERNDVFHFLGGSAESWGAEDEPAADINEVFIIRLDNLPDIEEVIMTENVARFNEADAEVRWELLAGDLEVPKGLTAESAVAFAEAIWMDTLKRSCGAEVAYDLKEAIFFEADAHWEPEAWEGIDTGWAKVHEAGVSAGALHRVEAWASGVPIDHVLAE